MYSTTSNRTSVLLELRNITYALPGAGGAEEALLREISFRVPAGHFMAIVGPSGCGKTTLLKVLAGILIESEGEIRWRGENLATEGELKPSELGYVPQFGIAYDHLTVSESVETAARLRVRQPERADYENLADRLIEQTGLTAQHDQRVGTLSGGQRRRLALAIELVSDPVLLLCDEVTSGLDPQAELEVVRLLHALSRESERCVINVTHSLSHIGLCDSVLALAGGRVAYHGPPNKISHWFSAESPEDIYLNLLSAPPEEWHASWRKHHAVYYRKLGLPATLPAPAQTSLADESTVDAPAGESASHELPVESLADAANEATAPAESVPEPIRDAAASPDDSSGLAESGATSPAPRGPVIPGAISQAATLLGRRWRLFFRDRVHLVLHLFLLFGFPCLVVIFASRGLRPVPQRLAFSEIRSTSDYSTQTRLIEEQVKTGTLISSLVLMQVILLALMGTNNAAREIAAERLIFEKEKLGGLRAGSYVASKVLFLGVLVLVQSTWMAVFVRLFCQLPGDFIAQLALLALLNAAMTALCLGLSSMARTAEQASLLGIYLAGFQLPLSGAVLRLPEAFEAWIRPLVSAYWSWAGQLDTMKPSNFFVGITAAVPSPLIGPWETCALVLAAQVAAGVWVCWLGSRRVSWH
jgi:ABC-type multidrug transport system ATPase subunit